MSSTVASAPSRLSLPPGPQRGTSIVKPGRVLNDRYELTEQLGQGGMAQVFRAHDRNLDRAVAVKVLPPSFAHEEGFVERFQREARAAASLNHTNIVGIYDTGLDEDLHYIVMELVEGPSLAQVIEDVGRVDVEHALDLALQVAGALAAAHEQGIIHRDIKPSNILFTNDGVAKVSDFGIARVVAEATEAMTDTIFGSVRYIAPEQAQAKTVDERADVYALGCVVYEMLTGRPPFTGEVPMAVLHQHVSKDPEPPSSSAEELPPEVDAVVLHALQKQPADRYPSAEEFRSDLLRLQAGDSPVLPVGQTRGADDETRAIRPIGETLAVPAADRTERFEAADWGSGGGSGPSDRITAIDGDDEGRHWWVWVAAFVAAGLLIAILLILLLFGGGGGDGDEDVEIPLTPETTTVRTDTG